MKNSQLLTYLILLMMAVITRQQILMPNISIINQDILDDPDDHLIIVNGVLTDSYNQTTYSQVLNCKNGNLNIINRNQTNPNGSALILQLDGMPSPYLLNMTTNVQPNQYPHPTITIISPTIISIDFNCQPDTANINNTNYFNKINIIITQQYQFSFLLNCDPQNRHKSFQFGYLIIAALDAAILISVALHSRVWSLRWNKKRLKFELRWFHALIVCTVGIILIAALYVFAFKDFQSAFKTVRYVGIAISAPFLFICLNQPLFLIRNMRINILGSIRYCDVFSLISAIVIVILTVLFQNWILYNFVAICICVACIKLLHFRSLKQAYLFMLIVEISITVVAIISHYLLSRSYNDYATQLSSPLFLTVPDLVNNLYKKCSWLPVIDVIIPGSTLSYLRLFDMNRSSRFGGVYTVWGNLTFILSTTLWVAIYVPFSLVTYNSLMLIIFLFARKRNEWNTLYDGNFQKQPSLIGSSILGQKNQRFSTLVQNEIFNGLKKSKISSASSLSLVQQN